MEIRTLLAALGCLAIAVICYQTFVANNAQQENFVTNDASGPLVWTGDIEAALKRAGTENKLVLVDVYTPWCGWCKRLDEVTFRDPSVVDFLNKGFVIVKLNGSDGAAGSSFSQKNGVRGYPSMFVLQPDGKVLGSVFGYVSAEDFLAKVGKIAGK